MTRQIQTRQIQTRQHQSTRPSPARATSTAKNAPLSRGQRRRRAARKTWRRGNGPIIGTLLTVAALIGLFVILANRGASTTGDIGGPVPDNVLKAVTQPDPALFASVGTGGLKSPFHKLNAPLLTSANGAPQVFYLGSETCPYCAAERWSVIMALSRFGAFKDLRLMTSGDAPEPFPATRTFTFTHVSYSSQYVDLATVEAADRTGQPLQTPTADQLKIISQYDAPPYTNTTGAVPFISYANQYTTIGAGYKNSVMATLTWQEIATKLADPNDTVTRNIVGEANYITAAICQSTEQQPAQVCGSAPIPDIAKQIAAGS